MIGDWVCYRPGWIDDDTKTPVYEGKEGVPVRLTCIYNDMAQYDDALPDGTINTIEVADFELFPIPITPEILEKNGIKLLEVGDNGVATPAKYRNRFEKWEIHTQWKDTYLWYDRQAKYWHLHDMGAARLYYAHDLQRALKLCGIDKEIIL